MLSRLSDVMDCTIEASDGIVGPVRDALFDDEAWVVRYLVASAARGAADTRVLIPPVVISLPRHAESRLHVSMTRQEILDGPPLAAIGGREARGHMLEGLDYFAALGFPESDTEYRRVRADNARSRGGHSEELGSQQEPHLRSANAMDGYHVRSLDGDVGYIGGFLLDERSWAIRFMIVDATSSVGHPVLIAPESIDDVYWSQRAVLVHLTRRSIEESPRYASGTPFNHAEGERTYRRYGLQGYRSVELYDRFA